ncbi:hypothetical protein GCM10017708_11340 [Arthrobacter citreus]
MAVIMMRRKRNVWPEGTYMRTSQDRLRAYVLTKDDMNLINSGRQDLVDGRKISQRLLAERAQVSASFINHLTAGRKRSCTPEVARRIAEGLEVPLRAIFDPEESPVAGPTINRQAKTTQPIAA